MTAIGIEEKIDLQLFSINSTVFIGRLFEVSRERKTYFRSRPKVDMRCKPKSGS